MLLAELIQDLPGLKRKELPTNPEVSHLTFDSREARPGTLFLAIRGAASDGVRYAPAAIQAGAVAVIADRASESPVDVPWIIAKDLRDVSSLLAARLHASAFSWVRPWGVTGTKGKTTTIRMLASILTQAKIPCGSVGTLGWQDSKGEGGPLANTTPDAARLGEIVSTLASRGDRSVALEASSQAAVQARLRHVPLAGLAFLNLSPEHAELHPTLEAYRKAKARLFRDASRINPELFVAIPLGDPDGEAMLEACGSRVRVLRFGSDPQADVQGEIVAGGLHSLDMQLRVGTESGKVRLGFGGQFNLQNALAAATLAFAAGANWEDVKQGLEKLGPVRGRFEVLSHDGVDAMVDYAHSSDALEKLLQSCRAVVPTGKILLVFGCGGKKDTSKRPKMGATAEKYADLAWITNDNPRGEDPQAIADEVLAGVAPSSQGRVQVELDRQRAIRAALHAAKPGDLVVVAGKGHETKQDLGDRVIDFDDRKEILRIWSED